MRFRTKTILGIALIEGLLLTVLSLSVLGQLQHSNEAEIERRVATIARLLSASLRDAMIAYDLATMESVATDILSTGDLSYMRVLDASDRTLVQRGTSFRKQPVPDKDPSSVDDGIYDRAVEVEVAGQRFGTIQFGIDITPLQALISKTKKWAVSISLLEMLLVGIFSFVLGTYLTRQLLSLRNASRAIARGELEHTINVVGNDELAETAIAFNHMTLQLREAEDARRIEEQRKEIDTERLRRQLAALHALNDIVAKTGLDPESTLRHALLVGTRHLNLEYGIISRIRADEYRIIVQVSPPDTLADEQTFPVATTLCAITLERNDVLAIPATDSSEFADHPGFGELKPGSYIGIPVRVGNAVFGTLNFSSASRRQMDFDESDLEFLRLLARWAGAFLQSMQTLDQLRASETMLRDAKEAAEAANVAKSRFLAMMSHEIRTPMNGILGMGQLLLSPSVNEAERLDYANTIVSSGQSLLSLLNDILDLSKIEADRVQLECLDFDPARLIINVASLFEHQAQAKGVKIETVWHGSQKMRYCADPGRLQQMLSNFVSNAVKFTEHGHVRISGQISELLGDNATLEYSVSDTGIGIAPDKLDVLFQPFSQIDASTTRKFGGTGLGLSIVGKLAKLMGGETGVESQPGKGSRFWFRIPVATAIVTQEAGDGRPVPSASSPFQSWPGRLTASVLVAEDNLINQIVISKLLAKRGITTTIAEDGLEALKRVREGLAIDLVLMDIQMPVMDGYEATDQIRRWERSKGKAAIPIIALTADAFSEDRQHCLAAGMNDFLSKPLSFDALNDVLERWLPSRSKPAQEEAKDYSALQ